MSSVLVTSRESGKVSAGCVIAVIVVIVAIGVGVFLLARMGLDMFGEQVKAELRDHPVILEQIGDIKECKLDLKATGTLEKEDWFVFDLVGGKANGELTVRLDTEKEGEMVREATLRTEDGKTHELDLKRGE